MFKLWMIQTILSLLFLLDQTAAQTLTNITVDDTDPSIQYVGSWEPSATHTSHLDVGGTHTLSEDPNGSATFTFTGVAVYYMSPKWPYAVNSYVSLDGGAPVLVDMTGPTIPSVNGEETVLSAPLWSATGLSNTSHRVVVTRGTQYAVVDGFIYTTQSADTTTSTSQLISTVVSTTTVRTNQGGTSTTSGTAASSTSSNTAEPKSNSTVIIIVTVSACVACLILLIILIIFCIRRKKKTDAAYRNSTAFGPAGGREAAYNIPSHGANTYNATYSAVPLTDNHPYTYPYSSNNAGSGLAAAGMEMGTRDSRYSAMGYSDSTSIGSASGALSLSAQQQMSYANAPMYGQDAYGLYPVSNRALVVPAAGAAYNTGGTGNGTDWYNASAPVAGGGYHGGDSGGHNVAAAYAGVGSSAAVAPPNQPPSPLSARARFEGSYTPYADGTNPGDAAYSGYAASTSTVAAATAPTAASVRQPSPVSEKARYNNASAGGYKNAHPYNAAGPISPSEPPPSYADRPGPSSTRPIATPSSPPRPNKKGFI